MRVLLIVNIVLCFFVLLVVPGLISSKTLSRNAYRAFIEEHSLSDSAKKQLDEIIDYEVEFQREQAHPKIVLPQIACGIMLLVNIYLLIRFKKS